MSYASDLGLKVGSKIKVIALGDNHACFCEGDIIEFVRDDGTLSPWFKKVGDISDHSPFSLRTHTWEHYKEEEKDTTKLKFPCCVATSEIKDEETFKKILDLFVANGATISEGDYEWGIPDFNYYGVDKNTYTKFWDKPSTYGEKEGDVTKYTLEQLLAFLPKEEVPVAQVTTLLPIGTEVKIAEISCYYGDYPDSFNPKGTKGTIIELEEDDEFCYTVRWENGKHNGYGLNDLVLWEEEKVADSEGWIKWSGGECPVAKGTVIDVKYRGGDITIGISANMSHKESGFYDLHPDTNENLATNWDIDYCDEDIIAYRLHVPSDTPSVASQEAITERLEDSPSVGVDYSVMGTTASTEPLYKVGDKVVIVTSFVFNRDFVRVGQVATVDSVSKDGDLLLSCPDWDYGQICNPRYVKLVGDVAATEEATPVPLITITQEVKYTVSIKGITFTFTQEEIDELAEELLGFTTL